MNKLIIGRPQHKVCESEREREYSNQKQLTGRPTWAFFTGAYVRRSIVGLAPHQRLSRKIETIDPAKCGKGYRDTGMGGLIGF